MVEKALNLLLIAEDGAEIVKRLRELDSDNQLEQLLDALLTLAKKTLCNQRLHPSTVPFLKKFFATLPPPRAKSIAEELLAVTDKEHSPSLSTSLLQILFNSVQLANAARIRELVRSSCINVHNQLRKSKLHVEADDLLTVIAGVLLFELELLDGNDLKEVSALWDAVKKPNEKPEIYNLCSYMITHALGHEKVAEIEEALCDSENLADPKFIAFLEPYIHIPLTLFDQERLSTFLQKILQYYLDQNKVLRLCDLIFNFPEIRHGRLYDLDFVLCRSVISLIWERADLNTRKRSADDDATTKAWPKLCKTLGKAASNPDTLSQDSTSFASLFHRCSRFFSKFVVTKKANMAVFLDVLVQCKELIPEFSLPSKLLLLAVMPFAVLCNGSEETHTTILTIYSKLLKHVPESHWNAIYEDKTCLSDFLATLIKRMSKESSQLRQATSSLVARFLHVDWTFVKNYVKGEVVEGFASLGSLCDSAFRMKAGIPSAETVTCLFALLNIYEFELDEIKAKDFKPKKGLRFLYDTCSKLVVSEHWTPKLLRKQSAVTFSLIADCFVAFVRINRLCGILGLEIEPQSDRLIEFLGVALSGNQEIYAANERDYMIQRIVESVATFGFHSKIDVSLLGDLQVLVRIAKSSEDDRMLKSIVKECYAEALEDFNASLVESFPVENMKNDHETRNAVLKVLSMVATCSKHPEAMQLFESYVFNLYTATNCLSCESMNFLVAFLTAIKATPAFNDIVSVGILTATNIIASQRIIKEANVLIAELKRSIAVTGFLHYVCSLSSKVNIAASQFAIISQLLAKLIANISVFRQAIISVTENRKRQEFGSLFLYLDSFKKQLTNICKRFNNSKDAAIVRQLPFVVSNCLTGEREQNLPTYHLLSGCDDAGISLLSTSLPTIEKRRFAITFPTFVEKNRF